MNRRFRRTRQTAHGTDRSVTSNQPPIPSYVVLVTRFDECCKDTFVIGYQMLRIALEGSGVNDRIAVGSSA